jgi:polar amino acid transport system substrate-binding protein
MGTSAEYPPFEFRKDGRTVGFDVDLAEEISKKLGYSLKIEDMEFNALIPALQSGRIDFVMAGMTVTEERKKNVDFSTTYYQNSFVLMTKKEAVYTSEEELSGKIIGAQLGSTMEKMGKLKSTQIAGLKIVSLGKNSILMEELKAGRLDGVIIEKVQAHAFSKAHAELHFLDLPKWNANVQDGYAIAFSKNQQQKELKIRFNQILLELQTEGKIAELTEKWIVPHAH